ncbi:unannotated protein [freshwater metagenome]|uniref:Unannotated protein n=1 Tax=freshwater metagenome TaxID=449393 RepID=A0A6J7J831_9ZZZZ|nr:HAD-IIB family hydrolase [Actinomycetota bacterium]MSW36559.1 HAD-IIB family hydrolase [Actinomycetota bacterium]MSX39215.1 HAD-IIB family hydrolase [Actinomycetota bacterium]
MTPAPDWVPLAEAVRLVATDLDGTLLRPDLAVSARTIATLERARAAGMPVVFVTGRPPRWIPPVVEVTGHLGVAICANGAIVMDMVNGTMLESHAMEADVIEEVVTTLRLEVPGISFAVEWVDEGSTSHGTELFARESHFTSPYAITDVHQPDDVLLLCEGRRVVKLLARVIDSGHDADGFLDLALSHVEHLVTLTHSNSRDVLLEMSAAGVSKGAALASFASSHGYAASEVAAVGDMPNDLPMIAWAGVGLGVAGAHPRVLEEADAVLPSPTQDGVAAFIDAALMSFRSR